MTTTIVRVLLGTVAFALAACSPQVKSHGTQKDVTATYSGTTLSSNLPTTARVPAVMAAADETLRARGYAVQRSSGTEESGEIVANAPRYNDFPRVVFSASRGINATHVEVNVQPFGDQELSRSLLDGVLQRLGL
jgi:hypothetical protein